MAHNRVLIPWTSKPPIGTRLRADGHWSTCQLIGLWTFNEQSGSRIYDATGIAGDGVVSGAVWGPTGLIHTNDKIAIPRTAAIEPTDVTLIIRCTIAKDANFSTTLAGKSRGATPNPSYGISLDDGGSNDNIYATFYDGSNRQTPGYTIPGHATGRVRTVAVMYAAGTGSIVAAALALEAVGAMTPAAHAQYQSALVAVATAGITPGAAAAISAQFQAAAVAALLMSPGGVAMDAAVGLPCGAALAAGSFAELAAALNLATGVQVTPTVLQQAFAGLDFRVLAVLVATHPDDVATVLRVLVMFAGRSPGADFAGRSPSVTIQ